MSQLVVREVHDIRQLQPLGGEWERLLQATSDASFFQSLEWLTTYWHHFGRDQQLRTLLVEQEQKLIGIVPLAVRRGRLGLRVLGYPLDSWGTFYGPLGTSTESILEAALRHLRRERYWDLLELRWTSGVHDDAVSRALRQAAMSATRQPGEQASWVNLDGSWEDYWMSRTSKWRNNVRRNEKRLAQLGSIQFVHYRPSVEGQDADPRWDLYEICEEVARASWQADSTTGNTLTHESVRDFLRDVHQIAAQRGCVSMHLLQLGDRPIAYAYNYVWQGRVFGLRAGFDSEFAQAGPGSVLLARIMQDGIERGDRVFDLGEGASAYKRHWCNRTVDTCSFHYHRPTSIRAQSHRVKHWITERWREEARGGESQKG